MIRLVRNINLIPEAPFALLPSSILSEELIKRGVLVDSDQTVNDRCFAVILSSSDTDCKDAFQIDFINDGVRFSAAGVRGLIYAIGLFLRKCEFTDDHVRIPSEIEGFHKPQKAIRGHQIGFRHSANSYDAWTREEYFRYDLDLMYFGANTVEHIPQTNDDDPAPLMKQHPNVLLQQASADADKLDLDVSLWIPNDTEDIEKSVSVRRKIFEQTPRINSVFIPGSDPGSLAPDALRKHCDAIALALRDSHPDAVLWPSAQTPHNAPYWGEEFLRHFNDDGGIAGVITGPNHAFEIRELRRRLPASFPIRFYPDITHNVRCEYPVHFNEDDWHYAFAATLSRECINPRPAEYALLHKLYARYTEGSVSYSDGVNDDVNKAVWSALEWDASVPVRDILADYSRLFFYGAPVQSVVDAIFGLEQNWIGSPETNPQIDYTLSLWLELGRQTPALYKNWRYMQGLFRASCDAYIRKRMLFESDACKAAVSAIKIGDLQSARYCLNQDYPPEISELRHNITEIADRLNTLIGMQLSVDRHGASGWERGATLDTIDLPITDLPWLRFQAERAKTKQDPCRYLQRVVERNTVASDEYYFSVALDGLSALGCRQDGPFYMDFQGDRPNVNTGSLPVCLQKLYDHISFRCELGGFSSDCDYILAVTYKNKPNPHTTHHKITANGRLIYEGPQFGGVGNEAFDADLVPDGFINVSYLLPASVFENGCLTLEISEPETGFELGELFIVKKEGAVFGSK